MLFFYEYTHTYIEGGLVLPSVTEICSPLTAGKYPPTGVVQAAAARGSRIHELCALYDMDALPDEIEADCIGYLKAWASFCRDYKPTWLRIEHIMSGSLGTHGGAQLPFAGTADRIGEIDGFPLVVDIKTASSLDRPAKIALACQLQGYGVLARCNGIPVASGGLGVQLKKTGDYVLHWCDRIESNYSFAAASLFRDLLKIHYICKGVKHA